MPVLVLTCQKGRPPVGFESKLASFYGSIIPAIWSFQLALRSRGLGSTFTTAHLRHEREVAEVVGIPFDDVAQIALIPVAHLRGDPASSSPRSAAEVTHWNRWGA
ncbi:hypothetical protein ACPW96_08730 [Micromonospora sp. DT81.3]|uniref:hypothetical protein n=1 Tax=Micromonospora sp. DT81.3 TaxID=3416523 RepID=UPI003CED9AA3